MKQIKSNQRKNSKQQAKMNNLKNKIATKCTNWKRGYSKHEDDDYEDIDGNEAGLEDDTKQYKYASFEDDKVETSDACAQKREIQDEMEKEDQQVENTKRKHKIKESVIHGGKKVFALRKSKENKENSKKRDKRQSIENNDISKKKEEVISEEDKNIVRYLTHENKVTMPTLLQLSKSVENT